MSSQAPTIAILGATGGVANSVVVHALRAGSKIVCLVRTPSKLIDQLKAQGLSDTVLSSQLTVVAGNALEVTAVKSALTANNTPVHLVEQVVFGLGGTPTVRWNWRNPLDFVTLDQPTLCGTAAAVLITALNEIYTDTPVLKERKPRLTFVSTTGISSVKNDVPVGLQTLYYWILHVPHMDKRVMESVFQDNMVGTGDHTPVFGGAVGVRPTLLTGGVNADEGIGHEKLRAGKETEPAKGYYVTRADVGQWIWVNVVGDAEKREFWEGELVSLTS